MQTEADEFLTKIDNVAGWLEKPAARRAVELLDWQAQMNFDGGLLEIGVFCGKFFAILLDSSIRTSGKLLGVDTFEFVGIDRVHSEMCKIFGDSCRDSFTLWKGRSDTFSSSEIESEVGKCRFISIDGSHEFGSVFLDLTLAEAIASRHCIVAVDDFLNPLAVGVNEATNAFLAQPRALIPVAYVANKLFLAHRHCADLVRMETEAIFSQCDDKASENFNARMKLGRHHVEQVFHGFPILIG